MIRALTRTNGWNSTTRRDATDRTVRFAVGRATRGVGAVVDFTAVLLAVNSLIGWVLMVSLVKPWILVAIGLTMGFANLSWVLPPDLGTAAAALGILTIAAGVARSLAARAGGGKAPRGLLLPGIVGLVGLLSAPAAASPPNSAAVSLVVAAMCVLLCSAVQHIEGSQLNSAAFWAVTVVMSASLAAIALSMGQTDYFGRAQGIFTNPNTLGMVGGLWCALALSRRWAWILVVPLGLSAILLSASRGAVIAVTLAVFAWMWFGASARTQGAGFIVAARLMMIVLAVVVTREVVGLYSTYSMAGAGEGLGRISDSGRGDLIRVGWQRFMERPYTGWGLGTEQIDGVLHPHILPLTLGFQLGVGGFVLATASIVLLCWLVSLKNAGLAALSIFGIGAMLSESWLYGAGSFISWSFWVALGGQWVTVRLLGSPSQGAPLAPASAPGENHGLGGGMANDERRVPIKEGPTHH